MTRSILKAAIPSQWHSDPLCDSWLDYIACNLDPEGIVFNRFINYIRSRDFIDKQLSLPNQAAIVDEHIQLGFGSRDKEWDLFDIYPDGSIEWYKVKI